ncbi:uncharacterized protein TNCV_4537021 [Trichonephila clavipes]|nr:uncharacterized protein TNCV_4537021 [Trichonephila clavipes]
MVNAEKKSIKEIRRHIAIAYLKKGNTEQKQICRPSYTIPSRVKKIDTVRHGVGHIIATRGLFAMDIVILNQKQVTRMTPEPAPPLQTTAPHQREDVSALYRFNVHLSPTRRVFSSTGLELMTCLPRSDTLTTGLR